MLTWLVLAVVGAFGLGAILGAPYLPILKRDAERLLDLAGVKAGDTLLDLGSGDGRLLRAAARRGARAVGYEINPWLYLFSRLYCWPDRSRITIIWGNYWQSPWPPADVIYVFLIERYMARLDRYLRRLSRSTRVVSYIYRLPRTSVKEIDNAYLYYYGS